MADIDTLVRPFTSDFSLAALDTSIKVQRTGYYEAPPVITSITLSTAPVGTTPLTFTIFGFCFRPNAVVTMGSDYTCVATFVSDTQYNVTATLSSTPVVGLHLVTLTQPNTTITNIATSPTGIDITNPLLTLTSSTVTAVPMGSTPISFTLTGTGFDPGIVTSIGAEYTCVTTFVNPTTATVVATLTGAPVSGARLLTVNQPDGQSAVLPTVFNVTNADLFLTSSTVTSATFGQTPISFTLTGTGFDAGMAVSIGAEYSCAVTVLGPTSATVVATLVGAPVVGARIMSATNPAPDNQVAFLGVPFVVSAGTNNPALSDVFPPTSTKILKTQPVSFSVTDPDNNLLRTLISARFPAQPNEELVFDGQGFQPLYSDSVRTSITGGFRYTIVRSGGWPGAPTIRIYAIDNTAREL